MSNQAPNQARVIPLRPPAGRPGTARPVSERTASSPPRQGPPAPAPLERRAPKEPLWRDLVGDALRRERLAQDRTLKDVADAARISMPYLSEVERGRKEASSEVLAAAAHALGLGLGDLLSLAQGELIRQSQSQAGRSRGRSTAPYNGLCLAA
ncbi:helix-turn-helix transcriptional regulator [Streptomyces sp. ALI-76-A]|uniref:helix-turn-helix domain-containing protein n=1 Tax=Streptomyces sp. ALI-76-A TaxID=3025736 RepID=UPI00256F487B|nr:helix-turn-helix transcriptional regulator [Streptomyces sp. ALI-76-A]MDL5199459.1 helix-turn-helix transcriptional regulator [Streptomyces sp. ALI-76-A]